MSDRIPIVYDTNEIGRRLKELERQRWGDRPKPLVLPSDVIIRFEDEKTASYPANVAAAFILYESRTRPILALVYARDQSHVMIILRKMAEFLREEFPSATLAHDHRIIMTVDDASRLAVRLRATRE